MVFRSPFLSQREDIVHGFTTRHGPDGARLDLGPGASDGHWAWVAEQVGLPDAGIAIASQVHGAKVLRAHTGGLAGEGDALITDQPGVLVAVRVADCVPIVVAGQGVVAAIHAGWRGLAAGVIQASLDTMAGTGPWTAVIGPCICVDCYEVGEEVVAGIGARVPESEFVHRDRARPHVDVGEAARWQLASAGVGDIDRINSCTRCDADLWSYRQEGPAAGRQVGLVGIRC